MLYLGIFHWIVGIAILCTGFINSNFILTISGSLFCFCGGWYIGCSILKKNP